MCLGFLSAVHVALHSRQCCKYRRERLLPSGSHTDREKCEDRAGQLLGGALIDVTRGSHAYRVYLSSWSGAEGGDGHNMREIGMSKHDTPPTGKGVDSKVEAKRKVSIFRSSSQAINSWGFGGNRPAVQEPPYWKAPAIWRVV